MIRYLTVIISAVLMTIEMRLLLYVLKCGLFEPDVQEARIGHSQPGVGLWSPHFFVLNYLKSGLPLNLHNKRHSFGLFISLYVCCIVDCINTYTPIFRGRSYHCVIIKTFHTIDYMSIICPCIICPCTHK